MAAPNQQIDDAEVLSVSRLNDFARNLLEEAIGFVWVEGELSNVSIPTSGHIYFTLKDPKAQVRCAMFRGTNRHLGFNPKDGLKVLVRAKVSLYTPRGDYQLLVEKMLESGDGLLRQAFEKLKKQLLEEGLFSPAHKKPLPLYPKQIGVITSPTGAAIRDILKVLKS